MRTMPLLDLPFWIDQSLITIGNVTKNTPSEFSPSKSLAFTIYLASQNASTSIAVMMIGAFPRIFRNALDAHEQIRDEGTIGASIPPPS